MAMMRRVAYTIFFRMLHLDKMSCSDKIIILRKTIHIKIIKTKLMHIKVLKFYAHIF